MHFYVRIMRLVAAAKSSCQIRFKVSPAGDRTFESRRNVTKERIYSIAV